MVGVEFTDSQGRPDKAAAKTVVHACLQERLLLLTYGPWDNTRSVCSQHHNDTEGEAFHGLLGF